MNVVQEPRRAVASGSPESGKGRGRAAQAGRDRDAGCAAEGGQRGSGAEARRLEACGVDVCLSKVSALEGAIRSVRWDAIPAEERDRLWGAFRRRTGG